MRFRSFRPFVRITHLSSFPSSLPPSLPSCRALWVAPVDFLVMIFTFLVTVLYNVEKVRPALPPFIPPSLPPMFLTRPSLPPSLPQGLEYGIIASVIILLLQISKLDMDSIGQLRVADDEVQMLVDPKAGTSSPSLPLSLLPALPSRMLASSLQTQI